MRLVAVVALCLATTAAAADRLDWNRPESRVDADVDAWPLPRVLETIRSATGWQVWVEPGTDHAVTAHFEKLPPADALRRLLGDLNFALLPQPDGPSKLFVYRHSVDAATMRVEAPAAPRTRPIPNELLVVLKDGAALPKRLEGHVVARLDAAGAYRLRFDDEKGARKARAALEREGDAASIETNLAIAPPAVLEPLAASSPAAPPIVADPSPSADRVVVGLVDTAVQRDAPALGPFLQQTISVAGDFQPAADAITHGTAMAETILDGIARALAEGGDASRPVPVAIIPVDVYGSAETTNTFDVARGMAAALDGHANIVNLSLAGDNDSPLLRRVIGIATDAGVLVLAAAGNTPGTAPMYPAADPSVIAVTAADASGNVAPWADHGSFVDAIAPGVNVVRLAESAWLGTGTSFSTTWVTGWAAGWMATAGSSRDATRQQTLLRWGMPVAH